MLQVRARRGDGGADKGGRGAAGRETWESVRVRCCSREIGNRVERLRARG